MEMDFDKKLYISQVIPTVQGEGPLAGSASLLVRLSGCNLRCGWCDSKYTWNNIGNHNGAEIVEDGDRLNEIIYQYKDRYNLTNIMITGGEPLLYRRNKLFHQLLDTAFETHEVETNGVYLSDFPLSLFRYGTYLNISPKLEYDSYVNKEEYYNLANNIYKFIDNYKYVECSELNYTFKFVDVKQHRNTVVEFLGKCNIYKHNYHNIRQMPWTPDRKDFNNHEDFINEYNNNSRSTLEYCMQMGFIFNPRIHLYLFKDENETL